MFVYFKMSCNQKRKVTYEKAEKSIGGSLKFYTYDAGVR